MIKKISQGRDLCFWLDTLIVPVAFQDGKGRQISAKKNAVSQISEIFWHAKYSIILNSAITSPPEQASPALWSNTCLNDAWMRRLRTLQETYSKEEQIDIEGTSNFTGLRGYLKQFMAWTPLGTSILAHDNTSYKDTKSTTSGPSALQHALRKHTMLMAKAWKVSLCRVS